VHLHAVIGGEGPPLLLVHGSPENWYVWRLRRAQTVRTAYGLLVFEVSGARR
jgi:pimeloyl-ACP methyl ester carboxylesterase